MTQFETLATMLLKYKKENTENRPCHKPQGMACRGIDCHECPFWKHNFDNFIDDLKNQMIEGDFA